MNIKILFIAELLFVATACKSQSTITATIATLPPEAAVPSTTTATLAPTETPSPILTPSDLFGAISLNSVQAFTLEPVAKAIFDQTLLGYITSGTIQEYRVDSISVFPSGNGALIAEIM